MRQSGDMVRSVCQPKHKIPDGDSFLNALKYCSYLLIKIWFNSAEQVFGAREGKFPDDKAFKVKTSCNKRYS